MQFFIEEQQQYAINAAVQIKGEIYGESYHIPFKDAFYMDESVLKTTFIPQRFTLLHDYISYRLLDDYRHTLKKMGSDIYYTQRSIRNLKAIRWFSRDLRNTEKLTITIIYMTFMLLK